MKEKDRPASAPTICECISSFTLIFSPPFKLNNQFRISKIGNGNPIILLHRSFFHILFQFHSLWGHSRNVVDRMLSSYDFTSFSFIVKRTVHSIFLPASGPGCTE